MRVTVAGAGMAGLVAAARLRELGHEPRVLEKGTRPGGSMLLSSCVVWRHLEWERFRDECPGGDEQLQRLIWERLDGGLAWLESLGAEPVWRDTENPVTTGRRYDPQALTRTSRRGSRRRGARAAAPGRRRATRPARDRAGSEVGWRASAICSCGRIHGARATASTSRSLAAQTTTAGMDEFYGRAMPAPPARIREEDFVPLAQLYGRDARIFTDDWSEITPRRVAWHENDLAQMIGRRAWYCVSETNDRIEAVRAAGGTVIDQELGLAVHVAGAVTHTIGGLHVDEQARVTGVEGLWAAGVDAGGVATGGYSSGLAQALVLGLAAADSIAAS